MGIQLTPSEALADAIASVRTEGLRVPPDSIAILERVAAGEITLEQAKQLILAKYQPPSLAPDTPSK